MFIDREAELAFFNQILQRQHPGPAQFILLYGRRRIGKTRLLQYWVEQNDVPFTYWAAEKEPAAMQRRKLFARVDKRPVRQSPVFAAWSETWEAIATQIGKEKHILILDELPYAAEADPAMISSLQHAWDGLFQNSQAIIVICGSQVQSMETLQRRQSPLFGRFTGQWHLQPLPFYTLKSFFPNWSAAERVAVYSIIGGVPAYFQWLDPTLNLVDNIQQRILFPGSMFLGEPMLLLYDEVREPRSYLAILKAIGAGFHTLNEISNECLIGKNNLSSYLVRLQNLKFIERRLPATVPNAKRHRSRQGRYHIIDPYFRFFFRFIAPFHETVPFDLDLIMEKVQQELRAFVGQTTFEELARIWVRQQARSGVLPFIPERIGSHWSQGVQVDVVGIQWRNRHILLGECKWGEQAVDKRTVRELIEKKSGRVLKKLPTDSDTWQVTYIFFARSGYTQAAREYARQQGVQLVTLSQMMSVLDKA